METNNIATILQSAWYVLVSPETNLINPQMSVVCSPDTNIIKDRR